MKLKTLLHWGEIETLSDPVKETLPDPMKETLPDPVKETLPDPVNYQQHDNKASDVQYWRYQFLKIYGLIQ